MKTLLPKILILLSLLITSVFSLNSCGHEHEWKNATCISPKTCASCGETEGEALGHSYTAATCISPKTCASCGETEGEALGHSLKTGICDICDYIDPFAESEQLCVVNDVIEKMEELEKYCNTLSLVYQRCWYFTIHESENYYSYDEILAYLSNYVKIDKEYINDATVDYLESLGLETSKLNGLAVLRGTNSALKIIENSLNLMGVQGICTELISSCSDDFNKLNQKVIGEDLMESFVYYCNVVFNYYDFAKSPSGSYNSYSSDYSSLQNLLEDAKNDLSHDLNSQ